MDTVQITKGMYTTWDMYNQITCHKHNKVTDKRERERFGWLEYTVNIDIATRHTGHVPFTFTFTRNTNSCEN